VGGQSDGRVDLADAVSMLQFLFRGGAPHVLAVSSAEASACVEIESCPETGTCR
jgi:hypothetical protein